MLVSSLPWHRDSQSNEYLLLGVSNGQGETPRPGIFLRAGDAFSPISFVFKIRDPETAFCEKTRLRDPRKLTEILRDSDFLRGPFDTPFIQTVNIHCYTINLYMSCYLDPGYLQSPYLEHIYIIYYDLHTCMLYISKFNLMQS